MRDFLDLEYKKLDWDFLNKKIDQAIELVEHATTKEMFWEGIKQYEEIDKQVSGSAVLCVIHMYTDGTDEFYFNEYNEICKKSAESRMDSFERKVMESPFAGEIERVFGKSLYESKKMTCKLDAIGLLLAEEKELVSKYQNINASIRYSYRGKMISAGELTALAQSKDREERKDADRAKKQAFVDHKDEIVPIFEKLMELRHKMAKEAGCNNYLELQNLMKQRFTYGEKELTRFCELVKEKLVPVRVRLQKELQKILGLETYESFDEGVYHGGQEEELKIDCDKLIEASKQMMKELHPDAFELMEQMEKYHYWDLLPSENKMAGIALTTTVETEAMPYIIENLSGIDRNVPTFLHEFGHAIQQRQTCLTHPYEMARNMPHDLVEIPSKFMEMIYGDYSHLFFGDKGKQKMIEHRMSVLEEICDYCALHEFETYLYLHPGETLETYIVKMEACFKEYDPYPVLANQDLLDQGAQLLISKVVFMFPFYVIGYALNDLHAMTLAKEVREDKEKGMEKYLKLCTMGGMYDFASAEKELGLPSAFSEEALEHAKQYLESIIF